MACAVNLVLRALAARKSNSQVGLIVLKNSVFGETDEIICHTAQPAFLSEGFSLGSIEDFDTFLSASPFSPDENSPIMKQVFTMLVGPTHLKVV